MILIMIEILLFALAIILIFYSFVEYFEVQKAGRAAESRTQSEQVRRIFNGCWNGKEMNREAAWIRTIAHLEAFCYPEEMILEARLHLYFLKEARRKDYTISSNGRLVKITRLQRN